MPSLTQQINDFWSKWVKQRAIAANPQQFNYSNLYILPSAFGWIFALVILTLFLCAINYQVSSVFFLTFLLAVAGIVSAFEAHFNLKGLVVNCVSIEDAFENEVVRIVLKLKLKKPCYALVCSFRGQQTFNIEKIGPEDGQIILSLPAKQRGYFQLPRITIYSYFPLGLFRVWGYIYLNNHYYVYPKPVSPGFWPPAWLDNGNKSAKIVGNEEVYELKPINNPWTQAGRIAWKIAARGQGWYLKTLVNPEGNTWLFRLENLPVNNLEKNLQHICYWLQEAEKQGYVYGLESKGVRTNFSNGSLHLTQCLRQLAIY